MILYQAKGLPAMQNVLFNNLREAIDCPKSDLILDLDDTGFVRNVAFDPSLVVYDDAYQNDQSCSSVFQAHLNKVADLCRAYLASDDNLVVDVGCGKGGFVDVLRAKNLNAVGYDNTYEGKSSYIRKCFFDQSSHETGSLLTPRHVLEHIQDPWVFIRNLAAANQSKGFLYIEVPDLDWILQKNAYYDLFHEHVNYFREADFSRQFPLALVSTFKLFHGQYLGVFLDLSKVSNDCNVSYLKNTDFESLQQAFCRLVGHEVSVYEQINSLSSLVIWGAASKGVVFAAKAPINLKKKIKFSIDINPKKSNRFMPISGVEVVSPSQGLTMLNSDDTVVIGNPNYEAEIRSALPSQQPIFVLR